MSKTTGLDKTHSYDTLNRYARLLGYGKIHTKIDPATGLNAIIAVHNTQLGPAIGGTRLYSYPSIGLAFIDALRLGYIMTLKAAFNDLPHGGAKAVILKPKVISDRAAFFHSYGDFIHELNGHYITAVDLGTNGEDMNLISERTPYVFGAAKRHPLETDPSPHTAQGIFRGIQASVQFQLNRDSLEGLHVVVQGAGHVGYALIKLLIKHGAKVTFCDPNTETVARCTQELGAQPVSLNEIYDIPCDVFSPCALGGVINLATIQRLKTSVIAGSANAQLAHRKYGALLHKKGILYAPDFVINSGGLIYAAMIYDYLDAQKATTQIDALYDRMLYLFERSKSENLPPEEMAEQIAKEKLEKKGGNSD
jgi:leucine dehydrogenase